MNAINKSMRVLRATFEKRNSADSSSKYSADLEAYLSGSACDVETTYGTPTDKVLRHLFCVSASQYLEKAGLPSITGSDWRPDARMLSGFARMPVSSDDMLYETNYGIDNSVFECNNVNLHAGVNVLELDQPIVKYRNARDQMDILFRSTANSINLLQWNGASGVIRYYPLAYIWTRVSAEENNGAVQSTDGDGYKIKQCGNIVRNILMNDAVMEAGMWYGFSSRMKLSVNAMVTSGIRIEYKIRSYSTPIQEAEFHLTSLYQNETRFDSIPSIDPNDTTPLAMAFKKLLDHVGRYYNTSDRTPSILANLGSNELTKSYSEVILLGMAIMSNDF